MSYYKDRMNAINNIDNILLDARSKKINIKIPNLVFEITKKYPVSEKLILQRINLIKQMNDDFIISGDVIEW